MKKIFIIIAVIAFSITAGLAQSADDIISKFITATGGQAKLDSITTLQYVQTIKFVTPMGNMDLPVENFIEKNKLNRKQTSSPMGGSGFTLISDTAGYMYLPANPFMDESMSGLKKMESPAYEGSKYLLEAEGFFPELVNYTTKGTTATLLAEEKINKKENYKIRLTLKNGGEIIYFIDKETNLVTRKTLKGSMAVQSSGLGAMMAGGDKGKTDKFEVTTDYKDYKNVNGLMLPSKGVTKTVMGNSEMDFSNIKINQSIDAKWYIAE